MSPLCLALRQKGVNAVLGSTSYYQDRRHFRDCGLQPDRGLVDLVAWLPRLARAWRHLLKLLEGFLNWRV